jgi:hypothetical protein
MLHQLTAIYYFKISEKIQKSLITSIRNRFHRFEILRLVPQNDITTQSQGREHKEASNI